MRREDLHKYLPIAVIAILIFLSFLIIRSYLLPLISAFILAYLVRPVYVKLLKTKGVGKTFAAILSISLIILIIFLPVAAVVGGIINQSYASLNSESLNSLLTSISESEIFTSLNLDFNTIVDRSLNFLIELLSDATTHIPSILIAIFVTVFGVFYILIDWDTLTQKMKNFLPTDNKIQLTRDMSKVTRSLVYGTLLIAIIEFIIAAVGFFISGVKLYLLLPTLIAIFAFIPGLGPTIVWIPLLIILIIQGNWLSAIGVAITGLVLTAYVDTVLRTKVASKGTKIHPLIILVGILGGISVFGIFGFIIGPLLLAYTIEILEEMASKN